MIIGRSNAVSLAPTQYHVVEFLSEASRRPFWRFLVGALLGGSAASGEVGVPDERRSCRKTQNSVSGLFVERNQRTGGGVVRNGFSRVSLSRGFLTREKLADKHEVMGKRILFSSCSGIRINVEARGIFPSLKDCLIVNP